VQRVSWLKAVLDRLFDYSDELTLNRKLVTIDYAAVIFLESQSEVPDG
jgi:hypothetical protein